MAACAAHPCVELMYSRKSDVEYYTGKPCLIFPLSICLLLSGEMAKQMKVKKLKNLKTLDSKPGKCVILSMFSFQYSSFFFMWSTSQNWPAIHSQTHIHSYEAADPPLGGAVRSPSDQLITVSFLICVCMLQVCTLHISRMSTKMKTSSNSFRRWDGVFSSMCCTRLCLFYWLTDWSHALQSSGPHCFKGQHL